MTIVANMPQEPQPVTRRSRGAAAWFALPASLAACDKCLVRREWKRCVHKMIRCGRWSLSSLPWLHPRLLGLQSPVPGSPAHRRAQIRSFVRSTVRRLNAHQAKMGADPAQVSGKGLRLADRGAKAPDKLVMEVETGPVTFNLPTSSHQLT